MKIQKKDKGITLIALVITIIVLLILASVSISMLTGDNGILTQAQRAKNETENAARKEEQDLAELEAAVTGKDDIIMSCYVRQRVSLPLWCAEFLCTEHSVK